MTSSHPSPADVQATFCAVLVDAMVDCGVRHAVIAPGSRSTPMALALATHRGIEVQVAHDERTAGFMALGVGVATGRPAVVLCTSGTAAVHLHAAVVEAHLSAVPLVVLTADRPPELHDVGAAQTIDQQRLYGSALRWFHDPGVPTVDAVRTWRSLGERIVAAASALTPGPVQINLPFREPLVGEVDSSLMQRAAGPTARSRHGALRLSDEDLDTVAEALAGEVRGVIIAGLSGSEPHAVAALADALEWPVLVEPRSGCGSLAASIRAFDSLLRDTEFARDHRPGIVLRLGEPLASKVATQWLAASGAQHLHLSSTPSVIDPDHLVQWRLVADPSDTLRRLAERVSGRGACGTPWRSRWLHAERTAQASLDRWFDARGDLGEPAVARLLPRALPTDSHLVVASSMPVRDVEWFAGSTPHVIVHSNRGANGIDGVIATAIGVAWATRATTGVLLGDLALLHDSSSLTALNQRGLDIRIVVVDNDGGGIFSFLPQAGALSTDRFEQLFGTPHGTDLEMLARAHHLEACEVTTPDEFLDALSHPGPRVIRVRTDRLRNVAAHEEAHRAARPVPSGTYQG